MGVNERSVGPDVETAEAPVDPAQARFSAAYLVVFDSDQSTVFELPQHGSVTIGRADTVDLRLESSNVSRIHARLEVTGSRVVFKDLGSQNGSRINGELIDTRQLLPGDVITIGTSSLVFHARP